MIDMRVNIAGVPFKNPVIAASGSFGFGREFGKFYDLSRLGGISVKGLSLKPRQGNPVPRIAEASSGMLNSVGLQNPGVEEFIREEIPFLREHDTVVIANIFGNAVEDYCEMARVLDGQDVDMLEMNISCPNVKQGGAAFGSQPESVLEITKHVRECTKKPLIVKLTPNVSDIAAVAAAAEQGGADAVSLINTLLGMKIDIRTRRPVLANNTGGLSGPAIKPVAVRMVYQAAQAVSIPVIGLGGIMNGEDAVEFLLAGASAVQVGTANLVNPYACVEVIDGIKHYMKQNKIENINEMVGRVEMN